MTRRRALTGVAAIAFVGALSLAACLDSWGHRDEPMAQADAIVVLGCALQADDTPGPSLAARTRHAVELWRQNRAPMLLFSGDDSTFRPSQAEAAAHYAEHLGVPASAILAEGKSRDTWENAELSAQILHAHHLERIILVSDPSHVWRARRHFQHFGLEVAVSGALEADELGPSLRVMKALSGMEVTLTAVLLLAAVRALHLRTWALAGVWLGLAPLARPEAALVAIALVLWSTALDRPEDRAAWFKRGLLLGGPALALGTWVVARNLATTLHPLPATYYAKLAHIPWSQTPARLWQALHGVLGQTPPLWHGLGLLFLLGLARRSQMRALLPLLAALAYLLAHVRVSELGDPRVFYALRYLLPIVPVLTVALVLGAVALGQQLPVRAQVLPLLLLALATFAQAGLTLPDVSWKLANDTRNIDEVQCAAGRWIHAHVPPEQRVATVDAGAVRYLGERWTLDLLGLNTPMMLWNPALYTRTHPVAAVVFMPELGKPRASAELVAPWSYRTRDYQVTQNPSLAFQAIVTCQKAADPAPRELALEGPGLHTLVWCQRF